MQREIRFRIWDKENKRFAHSDHYFLKANGELQEFLADNSCNDPECCGGAGQDHMFEVDKDRFVVMQFTGLKDKNGKEIYENDVIRWGSKNLLVEWREGGFGVRKPHLHRPKQTGWNWLGSIADPDEDVEIIGNIHEHPDLLK